MAPDFDRSADHLTKDSSERGGAERSVATDAEHEQRRIILEAVRGKRCHIAHHRGMHRSRVAVAVSQDSRVEAGLAVSSPSSLRASVMPSV